MSIYIFHLVKLNIVLEIPDELNKKQILPGRGLKVTTIMWDGYYPEKK